MIQNQFGRRNLDNYVKGSLSLRLEEYFKAKGKENTSIAVSISNMKRSENSICQKSDNMEKPKIEKVDTKKELSKVSGVSYDTIYKVKEIKSQTPAEILSELENINLITRKYLTGRRYKEEKKSLGGAEYFKSPVASNLPPEKISTAKKIGAQVGMSHQGVKDAEKFAEAVNTVHFLKLHSKTV